MRGVRSATADPRDFRYPAGLLAGFALVFVLLGIAPSYRQDWLLENLIVFAAVGGLIATRHRLRFSDLSYTLMFVLFVMHEVGAHYTYSLVPYDTWLASFGLMLPVGSGVARNQYDRLVHFAYGLLMLRPALELLRYAAPPVGLWRMLLPLLFILSHSAVYELIEMAAAMVFGGDLGTAYLGTQGDEWDAQKDMACAASGALIAMTIVRIATYAASVSRPARLGATVRHGR
jgi:putative membrane protein